MATLNIAPPKNPTYTSTIETFLLPSPIEVRSAVKQIKRSRSELLESLWWSLRKESPIKRSYAQRLPSPALSRTVPDLRFKKKRKLNLIMAPKNRALQLLVLYQILFHTSGQPYLVIQMGLFYTFYQKADPNITSALFIIASGIYQEN